MTTSKTAIIRKIQALSEQQIVAILADRDFHDYERIVYGDEINGEKFLNLSDYDVRLWKNRFGLSLAESRKVWSFISRIQQHPEELFPEAKKRVKITPSVWKSFENSEESTEQPVYIEVKNEAEEGKNNTVAKENNNTTQLCDDEGYLLMRTAKALDAVSNNIYEAEPETEVKNKIQCVSIPRKTYDPDSLKNRPLPPVPVENQPKSATIDKKENNKKIEISGSLKQIAPPKKTYVRTISRQEPQEACKNHCENAGSSNINDMLSKELQRVWEKQEKEVSRNASPQVSRKQSLVGKPKNILLPTPPPLSIEQDDIKNFEKVVKEVDAAPPAKYTLEDLQKEKFFKNSNDKQQAMQLLKNAVDGTFVVRQSKRFFCSITLKYDSQYYNVGIQQDEDKMLKCYSIDAENSSTFSNMTELINYYRQFPMLLINRETKSSVNVLLQGWVR